MVKIMLGFVMKMVLMFERELFVFLGCYNLNFEVFWLLLFENVYNF